MCNFLANAFLLIVYFCLNSFFLTHSYTQTRILVFITYTCTPYAVIGSYNLLNYCLRRWRLWESFSFLLEWYTRFMCHSKSHKKLKQFDQYVIYTNLNSTYMSWNTNDKCGYQTCVTFIVDICCFFSKLYKSNLTLYVCVVISIL